MKEQRLVWLPCKWPEGSWLHTFPAASGEALFCSRRLATSNFPYFAATWRGVNPFWKKNHKNNEQQKWHKGIAFLEPINDSNNEAQLSLHWQTHAGRWQPESLHQQEGSGFFIFLTLLTEPPHATNSGTSQASDQDNGGELGLGCTPAVF